MWVPRCFGCCCSKKWFQAVCIRVGDHNSSIRLRLFSKIQSSNFDGSSDIASFSALYAHLFQAVLFFLDVTIQKIQPKKSVPLLNESHVKPLLSSLRIYFRLFGPPKKGRHLDSVRPGHLWQQSQQQPPKSLCSISLKVSSNSWDFL